MIGKYVSATLSDESTGLNQEVEGHVESVVISGSQTYVVVDGKQVPIENVYSVSDGFNPLSSSLSAYTGLIGYSVNGAVYDVSTGDIVGVSGDVVSLAKGTYEDYAILNGVSAAISGVNVNGVLVSDRTKLREYLEGVDGKTEAKDRHVEVFVTDASGANVPIGATLRSFAVESDGSFTAVLDDVAIPVSSVAAIKGGQGAAQGVEAEVPPAGDDALLDALDALDSPGFGLVELPDPLEAGDSSEVGDSPAAAHQGDAGASGDELALLAAAVQSAAGAVAQLAAAQAAASAYGASPAGAGSGMFSMG
jgi:hypothetical protein